MGSITKARLALIAATAFWAGNYIVGRLAMASFDPFSLTLLRWALAVVPLLLIAQFVERPNWREALRHWPFLVMQAGFGLIGYGLLVYAALSHTTAFAASLINAANPALIAITAWALLRERLGVRGWFGIVLAFLGVVVLLGDGDPSRILALQFGTGELYMLGAIAVWTAYTVAGRSGPKLPPITSVSLQATITVVILGAAIPWVGITAVNSPQAWWSLIFIAVFPSCASYVLWNRALQSIPPGRAGIYLNLITVFTAVAALLMGTPITPAHLVGGTAVLAGVLLTAGRRPKKAPEVTPAAPPE